jgi:HlyD family secretion protein
MMKGKHAWLIAVALAGALALLAAYELTRPDQPEYFTAPVERGDVRNVVQVTGTINAVTTVLVGSQVSGTIA